MKTRQETFDYAVAKIIEQGRPSLNRIDETCAYRGDNGTRCAAGWFIPDELYTPSMEGARCFHDYEIPAPPDIIACKIQGILEQQGYDAAFVRKIQICHDEASADQNFLASFKLKCTFLAKTYGLEWKFD